VADNYSYDDPDLARAAEMFKATFGEAYGGYLCRQLHEGPVGINRFIMCEIGPRIWMRDKLDLKTRMFVAIAALVALGRQDSKFFMRGAFCNGATREEIEEVLLVTGQEAGYPCAAQAGRWLDEAEREHKAFMEDYEKANQRKDGEA
jgi:alkylhydroperoxidase/carboxymuconolactone decarboxylase family protein YurZ